jgi:hypothetical protein
LQPWAEAVISGIKPIENRTQQFQFRTPYPQRILLHTGIGYDAAAPLTIYRTCKALGVEPPSSNGPRGALLGIIELTDCLRAIDVPEPERAWAFTPDHPLARPGVEYWCYRVRVIERFKRPIPYKGKLGFFEVPDDVLAVA